MTEIEQHLAEARGIVDRVEREHRGLTESERRRAEKALERIGELKDNEKLKKAIQGMNGSLNGGGGGGDFAHAVVAAGFHPKSNPSVTIPLLTAMGKASTLPGVGDWNRADPVVVPMGRDQRFLNSNLIQQSVDGETAIQDFRQTARTVTGSVQRALDATTDKASLDVTLSLVTETLVQQAILIEDVPNAIFESVPSLRDFLSSEGVFQINKSLDSHAMSQIVAATPPFGQTGSELITKIRNAVASMRAEGANPTVLVLNPTDAATLDLQADAGGFIFPTRDTGSASPLWGLRVVERIGAGTEAPYLLDPEMLGRYYLGTLRFEIDPYTGFSKNLSTLRLEIKSLFHVRNAKGARRVAAA